METMQMLAKTIESHKRWKSNFEDAINANTKDKNLKQLLTHDFSVFDSWLIENTGQEDQKNQFYLRVIRIHSEFTIERRSIIEDAQHNQIKARTRLLGNGRLKVLSG